MFVSGYTSIKIHGFTHIQMFRSSQISRFQGTRQKLKGQGFMLNTDGNWINVSIVILDLFSMFLDRILSRWQHQDRLAFDAVEIKGGKWSSTWVKERGDVGI